MGTEGRFGIKPAFSFNASLALVYINFHPGSRQF